MRLLIFFGQRNEDDKNDSVESRQNLAKLDGSGKDQDELQRIETTLICREESNSERIGEIISEYKV